MYRLPVKNTHTTNFEFNNIVYHIYKKEIVKKNPKHLIYK